MYSDEAPHRAHKAIQGYGLIGSYAYIAYTAYEPMSLYSYIAYTACTAYEPIALYSLMSPVGSLP